MAYLDETVGGKIARKKPTVGGYRTQGKITPVPRRRNPHLATATRTLSAVAPVDSANAAGVVAQTRAQAAKAPVSTQMEVRFESDPVLARIKALAGKRVADTKAQANAIEAQSLIESGLFDIGAELGESSADIEAARVNPFSARATLERESAQRARDLDESLNQNGNLFFSGYRAQQLGDLAHSTAQAKTGLYGNLRGIFAQAAQTITDSEQAAAEEESAALEAAAAAQRQAAFEQEYLSALAGDGLTPELAPETIALDPGSYPPVEGVPSGFTAGGRLLTPESEMMTPEQYALMVALGRI